MLQASVRYRDQIGTKFDDWLAFFGLVILATRATKRTQITDHHLIQDGVFVSYAQVCSSFACLRSSANGPIFPVGDVDPRLPVHEDILGTITANGTPVAFPRATAVAALTAGEEVGFEDVSLELFAGGLRAIGSDGEERMSHQAFWFAWSQFHPETALWSE